MEILSENLAQTFKVHSGDPNDEELQHQVISLIGKYCDTHSDWKRYELFSELHYTRNLVMSNEHFELMVICWRSGQGSRIHDHGNSHCFMGILAGKMIEDVFTLVDSDGNPYTEHSLPSPAGSCPRVQKLRSSTYSKGAVGYINNRIGLHVMRTGELSDGVSLHLYAPPISRAKIFEPARGTITIRQLGFYSINGHRADPMERLYHDLLTLFQTFGKNVPVLNEKITILCKEYSHTSNDWKKYCFFNDTHYTRNLIRKNDFFELAAVCWKSGQSCRIQSHPSHTWMCVLEGQIMEFVYSLSNPQGLPYSEYEFPTPAPGPCPSIQDKEEFTHDKGTVFYVHDSKGLSSLRATELSDCVLLVLYYPPLDQIKVFEPARGQVSFRKPGYNTIGGVPRTSSAN